jgi:FkbH-like protein
VILAVCSKNSPEIAVAPFLHHPEMILKRKDFACFVANWGDKAENLRSIASQLNIGLDSVVFVDDNPVERARVRESLPMVAVPELPTDPAHFVGCIADAGYFEAVSFTEDDRNRAIQYAANAERAASQAEAPNIDDFLRGLKMTIVYGPIMGTNLIRASQLINKTNQFNTTSRRYTTEEVAAFATDKENLTLQFRLIDRFGDNGLVSVMILRAVPDEPRVMDLVTWVMSCRVFGRQLEDEAMNLAVEAARERGVRELRAEFVRTPKNGVIKDLFDNLGFARVDEGGTQGVSEHWTVSVADYSTRPTHISRRAEQ